MAPTPTRVTTLMQTLIDGAYSMVQIPTTTVKESEITPDVLAVFDHARPIGISPGYSGTGRLVALAIADDEHCRIIEFEKSHVPQRDRQGRAGGKHPARRNIGGLQLIQDMVLCRPAGDIYAFDLGPLSMSLYCDATMRITKGVDIQSGISAVNRKPLSAIMAIVGDTVPIMKDNIITVFRNPIYDREDRNRATDLAMRAWVSQFLAGYGNGAETFAKVKRIDTAKLSPQLLETVAKIASDSLRLDQLKPVRTAHQVTTMPDVATGQIKITSTTYKSRIRSDQTVRAAVREPGFGEYFVRGQVGGVTGKSGPLNTSRSLNDKTITTLISIGRDDPTTAEAQRAATILRILQGSENLLGDNPWIQNIWFPTSDDGPLIWPEDWSLPPPRRPAAQPDGDLGRHDLNSSQQDAVNTMLSTSSSHRITIIQGPPGTGKTSVIATYVQFAVQEGYDGIWLVAQSNVAVKNIAEKLVAVGFFDWKLLVSRDFHFEWHEHLYTKVQDNVIRSDQFKSASCLIKGCKVFLCTVSMLSNRMIGKFTLWNPIRILVVDEASQIEVGDYISVLSTYHHTLRKACFIGDDKQLPPYGQEDLQDLQSIFEISHLHKLVLFLNIQYRMPPQIGRIISEAVYDNQLHSNPTHSIGDEVIACQFIDIAGTEKRNGDSFMNILECEAVLKLAHHLQEQQKSYQFITPYEGQRSTVEAEMKNTGLQWENKCFNVDAFQGNEEDYIIVSLVRSRELGFLANLRRTNVMLTRCKKGMYIVSSRKFLNGVGSGTLAGTLLKKMGDRAWLEMKDIDEGNF